MNKIFKVIWNHATQTWVAVSELQSARGKTKSRTTAAAAITTAVIALGGLGTTIGANAATVTASKGQDITSKDKSGLEANQTYGNTEYRITYGKVLDQSKYNVNVSDIAIGTNATAMGKIGFYKKGDEEPVNGGGKIGYAIAIGTNVLAYGSPSAAIGNSLVNYSPHSYVIGSNSSIAEKSNHSLAIGTVNSIATKSDHSGAVGNFNKVGENSPNGFAVGVYSSVGNRSSSSVVLGTNTQVGDDTLFGLAINFAKVGNSSSSSMAIGPNAEVKDKTSAAIAFGSDAKVMTGATNGIAIGSNSRAVQGNAVAMGTASNASAIATVAIGSNAKAINHSATSVGQSANASGLSSVSIGQSANASGSTAISVGQYANALNKNALALGTQAKSLGANAVAIGSASHTSAKNAIAIGTTTKSAAEAAVAIGSGSKSSDTAKYGVAVGRKAETASVNAIAIGHSAVASLEDSVALGSFSTTGTAAPTNQAIVGTVTYSGFAGNNPGNGHVVSVGGGSVPFRQIQNVAAGRISSSSTDAINGSQLYMVMDKIVPTKEPVIKSDGNVTTPNNVEGPRFVNATTLANVVNKAGWKLTSSDPAKVVSNTSFELINPGDEVKFTAGDNIEITQTNGEITIKANIPQAPAATPYTFTAKAGATQAVENGKTLEFLSQSPDLLTVALTQNNGDPQVKFNVQTSSLPTLNSGNTEGSLSTTGNPGVVTGNTLAEAINSSYWRATVANTTGTSNQATDNVAKVKAGNLVTFTAGSGIDIQLDKANANYTISAATTTLPADTAKPGALNVTTNGDKLVNASTIAKAINESGWNVDIDRVEDNYLTEDIAGKEAKPSLVSPGENVVFKAGKNLRIKKEGNDVIYATKDNATFTSVQFGDEGPKITNKDGNINVSNKDDQPTKITGVANGTVAADSKDAINGSQLYNELNAHKWVVTTDGNRAGSADDKKEDVSIGKNDKVTFIAGDNLTIKQAGSNITFSAKAAETTGLTPNNGNITTPIADGNKLVNATTVANAINNVSWTLKENNATKDAVKAADVVNFVNGTGTSVNITTAGENNSTVKVNVKTDGKTITVDPNTGNITAVTGNITNNTTNPGKLDVPANEGDKLVNQTTVVNAINNASHKVAALNSDKQVEKQDNAEGQSVKAGDKVNFIAGKNLVVNQGTSGKDAYNVTFGLAKDIEVGNVTASNLTVGPVTINKDGGINAGNTTIANVTSNLPNTYNSDSLNPENKAVTTEQALPDTVTTNIVNNAATVGDVLNAGWNLQNDGVAKDFVKPYDKVNFNSTATVTAKVVTEADGIRSNISFDVKTTTLDTANGNVTTPTTVEEGSKLVNATTVANAINNVSWTLKENNATKDAVKAADVVNFVNGTGTSVNITTAGENNSTVKVNVKTDGKTITVDPNTGNVTAVTGDINFTNPTTPGKIEVPTGPNEGSKLVNQTTVVNAINASGWNATVAAATGGTAKGASDEQVNPGDKVTFKAGKNMHVLQEGPNFTYSTKENVTFTSVQFGDENGPKITNDGDDIKVGNVTGGPVAITNVKSDLPTYGDEYNSAGLIDLGDVEGNPIANNAATVGDLARMGWVIGTPENDYEDQVRNADTVEFVGSGMANVGGATVDGVRTILVHVDAQNVINNSQQPVVYTNKDGDKVFKQPDGSFNTSPDGTGTKVEPKDVVASMNNGDNVTAPTVLTNVGSNLPNTYNQDSLNPNNVNTVTNASALPNNVGDIVNNAATVGDVLNAGWNIQGDGKAKDFVKPYDTVNFNSTSTVIAKVETDDKGLRTNISFDVNTTQVIKDVQGDITNNANGTAKTTDTPDTKLATTTDVVNAINKAGWNATVAAAKDGTAEGATQEQVNPGETVTFKAGKNMHVLQEGANFTYSTKDNVTFTSVQFGDENGPKITNNGGNINVGNVTGGPVAITNVKSELPTYGDEYNSAGLIDLDNVEGNPIANNVATVGDLARMGWVIGTPENGYEDQVRNAHTVEFIGSGMANVGGFTSDEGVRTVLVHVDAQNVINNSQQPVVYSTADGTKVFKQPDGTFNTEVDGSGDTVNAGDVIASMNNGNNETKPTALTNIGSSIKHDPNAGNTYADSLKQAAENPLTVNNAVNVGDLNNAIQGTGFNLATKSAGGQSTDTATDKRVSVNDTFTLDAGKNIEVKQINDGYEVALSKDVDLTTNGSLKVGDVTINKDGINAGGDKITNVAEGDVTADSKDAVNGSQLYQVQQVANAGWNLSANGKDKGKVAPGASVDLNNTDGNIKITKEGNNVSFNLASVVKIGNTPNTTITIDGDKGTIGGLTNKTFDPNNITSGQAATEDQLKSIYNNLSTSITNSGFDLAGKKVEGTNGQFDDKRANDKRINNNDKFTLDAGKNIKISQVDNGYEIATTDNLDAKELVIRGEDGKDGKPGKAGVTVTAKDGVGTIGINGKDGANGEFTFAKGPAGVNGKDGETKTRIEYIPVGPDGKPGEPEKVATLKDGLKFVGNDGKEIVKELNQTLEVVGGIKDTDANPVSDKNTYVSNKDGKLVVQISENPEFNSVKTGDTTINNNGLTINNGPSITKTGVDAAGNKVTNVKDGDVSANSKDAVNGSQLHQVKETAEAGWNLTANGKNKSNVKPRATVDLNNKDRNIEITKEGNNVTFGLAKDIDLGDKGSVNVGGVTINNNGINAGNKVISNVAPGKKPTDAVNKSQLDGAVTNINNKINRNNKQLRAGIAGANAAAGLPQVYIPGKSMVAAAAGTFKGQSAVAVGYSRASDNGKLILKLQGNANTRGDFGGSVGVGYQW